MFTIISTSRIGEEKEEKEKKKHFVQLDRLPDIIPFQLRAHTYTHTQHKAVSLSPGRRIYFVSMAQAQGRLLLKEAGTNGVHKKALFTSMVKSKFLSNPEHLGILAVGFSGGQVSVSDLPPIMVVHR